MVWVTEKRTHKIPSCRVDKELLLDIGNVVESNKKRERRLAIGSERNPRIYKVEALRNL